jgi:hypothetical protein
VFGLYIAGIAICYLAVLVAGVAVSAAQTRGVEQDDAVSDELRVGEGAAG